VNFTDLTISGASITSWFWNFDDGSTSNLQNPSHSLTTPGSYDVSLTVTDIDGCLLTVVKQGFINVSPVANLSITKTHKDFWCMVLKSVIKIACVSAPGAVRFLPPLHLRFITPARIACSPR